MLYDPGLHIGIRHRRRGIHMGNEAKYRSFLAACRCRNRGIDITVLLVISDLCGPHGLQFAHQLSGQIMLFHGTGDGGAFFTGLGIDLYIS